MDLLLDTHAWLWFVLGDTQLSVPAIQQITSTQNRVFVSPASLWELAIKVSRGSSPMHMPFSGFLNIAIAGNNFKMLPIEPSHVMRVASLPFPDPAHKDPFDRMLISQAMEEGMSLVSCDRRLPAYGVPLIW